MTASMHTSSCDSVGLRAAAGAIGMVVVAALAACQPLPPTPIPNPRFAPVTAAPGHISTLIARLTERSASPTAPPRTATASPTASPSATATPLPLDAPVVVGVPLEEAEREVLSWLDPAREPRLEWSAYVRRETLAAAKMGMDSDIDADHRDPETHDSFQTVADLGDPLLLVMASTRGMDPFWGLVNNAISPRGPSTSQPSALSPDRLTVLAIFDALTGARQSVGPIRNRRSNQSIRTTDYIALPTAVIRFDQAARLTMTPNPTRDSQLIPDSARLPASNSPYATPTATATEVPKSAQITKANLPEDLRDAFVDSGLAPGSTRTWFISGQDHDVRWFSSIVTETMEAAWLHLGAVMVRSRFDERVIFNSNSESPLRTLVRTQSETESLYFTRAAGSNMLRPPLPGPSLLSTINLRELNVPYSLGHDFIPIGDEKPWWDISSQTAVGPMDLQLPSGYHRACWYIVTPGGAGWFTERWLCPGVGVAQFGRGAGYGDHNQGTVATLINYRFADLPER